jgi:UDP-N-acetylglucosamine 2-epimerase
MKLLHGVGARPQFVKLAPVSRELAIRRAGGQVCEELIVHTGQHYDAGMSDVFFAELGIPPPTVNLGAGSGLHGAQTARMLEGIERVLLEHLPDVVVVYGDTNSTLAGALAATKLGIRVAHVEAGLRSFNRRMPEELNRVATDHLADLLLAPTAAAMAHLEAEGLGGRSLRVGDVMQDALLFHLDRARRESALPGALGLEPGRYLVATVHRAENTEPDALRRLLGVLAGVGTRARPLVLPLHPRTRAAIEAGGLAEVAGPSVRFVDPLPYLDMLRLVEDAGLVLTDSGGLQKEAFMLGTPCVTLRGETEWTETVEAGANVVAGVDSVAVLGAVETFAAAPVGLREQLRRAAAGAYGGGTAARRIVDALTGVVAELPSP